MVAVDYRPLKFQLPSCFFFEKLQGNGFNPFLPGKPTLSGQLNLLYPAHKQQLLWVDALLALVKR
jgi:hypothetical protein